MCWHSVRSLVKLEGRLDSMANQQVLKEHMLTDAAALIEDDFVFQQDNAPIYTSRSTRQWLSQPDATLLGWPPKSSDANLIEIVRLTSQSRDIPELAILGGKHTNMATSCSVFGCHYRRIQGSNIRF